MLNEELGLEPSPRLRSFHQAILAADPVLDARAHPVQAVAGPRWAHRAAAPPRFRRGDVAHDGVTMPHHASGCSR
ncbi:MAG: hypothetical protein ACRDQ4_16645 [Pseudonocardiaceae bacterium]